MRSCHQSSARPRAITATPPLSQDRVGSATYYPTREFAHSAGYAVDASSGHTPRRSVRPIPWGGGRTESDRKREPRCWPLEVEPRLPKDEADRLKHVLAEAFGKSWDELDLVVPVVVRLQPSSEAVRDVVHLAVRGIKRRRRCCSRRERDEVVERLRGFTIWLGPSHRMGERISHWIMRVEVVFPAVHKPYVPDLETPREQLRVLA